MYPFTGRRASDRRVFHEVAAAANATLARGAQTTIVDVPCSSCIEDAGRASQPSGFVEAQSTCAKRDALGHGLDLGCLEATRSARPRWLCRVTDAPLASPVPP